TNLKRYQALPAELRQAVDEAGRAACAIDRKAELEKEKTDLEFIKKYGVQVNDVKDLRAFQERMGPAYDLVTTKVGKEWMDRVMAAVKQLQIDLIHYSIVVVAATGIGLFLPPIGVGLFISCGIANISVDRAVGPCSRTWRFSAWDCCS